MAQIISELLPHPRLYQPLLDLSYELGRVAPNLNLIISSTHIDIFTPEGTLLPITISFSRSPSPTVSISPIHTPTTSELGISCPSSPIPLPLRSPLEVIEEVFPLPSLSSVYNSGPSSLPIFYEETVIDIIVRECTHPLQSVTVPQLTYPTSVTTPLQEAAHLGKMLLKRRLKMDLRLQVNYRLGQLLNQELLLKDVKELGHLLFLKTSQLKH